MIRAPKALTAIVALHLAASVHNTAEILPLCCRGANSTYNVVVGRSKKLAGPYVDKAGKPMMDGGGTLVISSSTGKWRAPGHEAGLHDSKQDYPVFHAYSAASGRPLLQISRIDWNGGWTRVGSLD